MSAAASLALPCSSFSSALYIGKNNDRHRLRFGPKADRKWKKLMNLQQKGSKNQKKRKKGSKTPRENGLDSAPSGQETEELMNLQVKELAGNGKAHESAAK
jgi:hypothetical protein